MEVDSIHNGEFFELSEKDSEGLVANQFLKVVSALDEKKSAIVRYNKGNRSVSKLKDIKDAVYGKIKPRNKEQNMALNLLLDHNISVVTLIGKAGCGKTVAALAAALQMQEKEPERYRKIIVLKPIVAVGGKDVGYLPGSLQEKLSPWLAPIYDNLEFLLSSKKSQNNQETLKRTIDWYFENGIIEVEAMTYIRGRSLANCIIILDEAQNTNAHEIKTILTRVGEGTKIILTGDIEQVDSPYLDSTNNGLVYLIEKFKGVDFYGHVTFLKGERSKVATVAAERL
jgi:PhoH-like ATPase